MRRHRLRRACCLNRTVHGYGAPSDVLTEEVLARTFDRHLITVGEGGISFGADGDSTDHDGDHGAH